MSSKYQEVINYLNKYPDSYFMYDELLRNIKNYDIYKYIFFNNSTNTFLIQV